MSTIGIDSGDRRARAARFAALGWRCAGIRRSRRRLCPSALGMAGILCAAAFMREAEAFKVAVAQGVEGIAADVERFNESLPDKRGTRSRTAGR